MNVADIFNKKNLADIVLIVSVIVSAILSALIFNYALKMTFISAPSFMIASSGFNADSKNTDLVKQTEYEESVSKILRSGIGASPSGSSTPFSGVNLREADFSGEGNPILKATFIGDSASFAVVQFNGIDKIILPGSRIGQAVLEEILRDRAVFRLESGEKYELIMSYGIPLSSNTSNSLQRQNEASENSIVKYATKREFLALFEPPDRIMKELLLAPISRNGTTYGIKILKLSPSSFLSSNMGLAPGDIILAINNKPILSPEEGLAAYQAMKNEDEISFNLERNGKPVMLKVSFR